MIEVLALREGWDEAAFVVAPMAALAVVLWLARRRAERELAADDAPSPQGSDGGDRSTTS